MLTRDTNRPADQKTSILALVVLLIILLGAAALRLDFLFASDFRIESDEAIVGLMAKHWLEGNPLPIFYYGQHYMGSLEALAVGLGFALFGYSSAVLKLVPFMFSLLLVPVIYLLTKELTNRRAGLIAALLYAFAPAVLIIWSSKPRGGFIELILIGALSFLFFIRWLKQQNILSLVLCFALLGFGWWVNNQIIYYMIPIAIYCLAYLINFQAVKLQTRLFQALVAIIAFFAGSFLYWYYNFQEEFASLAMLSSKAEKTNFFDHFLGLLQQGLPVIFGAHRPWQTHDWFPGISLLSYLLIFGSLFLWARLRRQDLKAALTLKMNWLDPQELLLLHCITVPLVFISSSFGHLSAEPRYLLPIYSSLIPLLAITIEKLIQQKKYLGRALIFVFLGINLGSCYFQGRAIPGEPFVFQHQRASKNHFELIEWLKTNNYQAVKTNYWIGYRLAFESEEAIKFAVFDAPREVRIPAYEEFVRQQPEQHVPLVLVPGQATIVVKALDVLGYQYKTIRLSDYIVIYNLRRPAVSKAMKISKKSFAAEASSAEGNLSAAFDNKLSTRWGSAEPQHDKMHIKISFKSPLELRGLAYELGDWPQDYPRSLRIVAIDQNQEEFEILSAADYQAISYYLAGSSGFLLAPRVANIMQIHFYQEGVHPIFDWSVAELEFYGFLEASLK